MNNLIGFKRGGNVYAKTLSNLFILILIVQIFSLSASLGDNTEIGQNTSPEYNPANNTSASPVLSTSPIPGNWMGYGGVISGNRPLLGEDNDDNKHVFVTDQTGALWDNKNGNWYRLGGSITGNFFWAPDGYGKIHVIARGSDNGLWDAYLDPFTMSCNWISLGGTITSSPGGTQSMYPPYDMVICARGSDGHLMARTLSLGPSGPFGGSWTDLGGSILGTPCALPCFPPGEFNVFTFVKQSDNHLAVNVVDASSGTISNLGWTDLGCIIHGFPTAARLARVPTIVAFATDASSNHALWAYELDVETMTGSWYYKGGATPADSNPFTPQGGPIPLGDGIHVFVRGTDNALWDCVTLSENIGADSLWYNLGGSIKSDAGAMFFNERLRACVQGADDELWRYRSV
jgi:hypothetical protein